MLDDLASALKRLPSAVGADGLTVCGIITSDPHLVSCVAKWKVNHASPSRNIDQAQKLAALRFPLFFPDDVARDG